MTLVNNLVVGLKNSRSFEEIKHLNEDLQEKNIQLEKALKELRAALKKVELLESIKANLSKFVPTTVTRMIEGSPTGEIQEGKRAGCFRPLSRYRRLYHIEREARWRRTQRTD